MAIRESEGFGSPGVAAIATIGLQREATFASVGRKNDDAPTGSAPTTGIVGGPVVGRNSVRRKCRGAAKRIGTNDDDAAAGGAAAGLIVTVRVVARTRAASTTQRDAVDRCRERNATLTTIAQICVP